MKKKLRRSNEGVLIAGVIAGFADYFEKDPVLFRIAAIAFLLLTGIFPGLLLYLAAWLLMPVKDESPEYEVVG